MVFGIAQRSAELLRLLDVQNFTVLVVAALRACPVRHLLLVTIRALRTGVRSQEIVCAADGGAALGVAPFWIWHD